MSPSPDFLGNIVRSALGRGPAAGSATAPPQPAGAPAAGSAVADPADQDNPPASGSLDPGILDILAQKVLLAWLRNRHQLLFPFALDLRRLDERQTALLVHAMAAAAQADGVLESKERERIEGALGLIRSGGEASTLLEAALTRPRPLNELLGEVHDVQTGALIYAASLMAVDQRKPVNRFYLKYLAARLQLSEELVGSLEHRFHSSA